MKRIQKILATTMIIIMCFSIFTVFAPKIMAQQSIQTNFGSTLWISSGSGTFSSISKTSLTINVAPGQILSGSITLQANNNFPSDAIVPLIGTPSWGDQTTSWWLINSWLTTGTSYQTTNVNKAAPTTLGTYYLIFAFNGELNGAQVASATQWPVGHLVWNDRNDIAEFNSTQILQAQQNGAAENDKLTTNGYQAELVPSTVVTIIVGPASSSSTSPTPTALPTPTSTIPSPTPRSTNGDFMTPSSPPISVSPPSTSPLTINVVPPSIRQSSAPFTTTFLAIASGGTKPYSIVYTIRGSEGNSFLETNPLTWTFKYPGAYYVTATVTDSKSNTATSPQVTINTITDSYAVSLGYAYGSGSGGNFFIPNIVPKQNDQPFEGKMTINSTINCLETDVNINLDQIGIPWDWVNSLLGFSNPWYTLTVSGAANFSPVAIQESVRDSTHIVANFPMGGDNVTNNIGLPYGTHLTYTFNASPKSALAIALDLVSILFTYAGMKTTGLTLDQFNLILVPILENLALQLSTTISDTLVSLLTTNFLSLQQTLSTIYGTLSSYIESLLASVVSTVVSQFLKIVINNIVHDLTGILSLSYNLITNLGGIINGDISDTYTITNATPLMTVTVDPNEVLNAILYTSQGEIGYLNGVWENTGNFTGFTHTDVANNTYAFSIPVSNQRYNGNLTITSPNGESSPYAVTINWGNQTTKLTGTVNGREQKSFPVTISGGALTVKSPQANFPYIEIILVIGVIMIGVAALLVVRKSRSKKRDSAVKGNGTEAPFSSAQDTKMFSVEEIHSAQASRVFSSTELQRLEQLKSMLNKGLITQEDYDNQKKKLLSKT